MKNKRLLMFGIGFLSMAAITSLIGSCSVGTINPGEVGVLVCFGKPDDKILDPGIHVYSPWCKIERISTRTQTYTMAGNGREGNADSSVTILTRDQLSVSVDVSVMFHLNKQNTVQVFQTFGEHYDNSIVHPLVRTSVRDAASEFNAVDLVDQRQRFHVRMNELVRENLASTLRSRNVPTGAVVIDSILLRNVDLPETLDEAIANVQRERQATVRQTQARQTAEQEAQRILTVARGESRAMLTRAEANARASTIQANAQAENMRILANSLTPDILRLRQIEAMQALASGQNTRVIMIPANQQMLMPLQTQ